MIAKMDKRFWLFLAFFSLLLMVSSCSSYVKLNASRYIPKLGEGFERYRGTAVYVKVIKNVEHSWDWGYRSSDSSRVYYLAEKESIETYFYHCLEVAFNSVGVTVFKMPGGDSPRLSIEFTELTGVIYVARVSLENKLKVFNKSFIIAWPAYDHLDLKVLEESAYKMIDRLVVDILRDQYFQKAFLGDA